MMTEPDLPRRLGRGFAYGAWLLALGLMYLLFRDVEAEREHPNRNLRLASEASELVLQRNAYGHYLAEGLINGRPVTFLLDTGATVVSVPAHLASALKLEAGPSSLASTANGTVRVYATRINTLNLGPFELNNVRASINPGMAEHEILLGMSVLKQLEFTQRGEQLILRAMPSS